MYSDFLRRRLDLDGGDTNLLVEMQGFLAER